MNTKNKYKKVNKVLIFEVVFDWNRFLMRNLGLNKFGKSNNFKVAKLAAVATCGGIRASKSFYCFVYFLLILYFQATTLLLLP
jgi:hypothetical protein